MTQDFFSLEAVIELRLRRFFGMILIESRIALFDFSWIKSDSNTF